VSGLINQNTKYKNLVSKLEERQVLKVEKGLELFIKKVPDSDAEGELDPRVFEIARKKYEGMTSAPTMNVLLEIDIKNFPINQLRAQMGWPNKDVTDSDMITLHHNIEGKNGIIPTCIYFPQQKGGRIPAIVFLHGGGFIGGSIKIVENACKALAEKAGAAVISVDYRLAPENPFPAGLTDCFDVVQWVYEHADKLIPINREQIAIAGDSAGANLATVCSMKDRDLSKGIIKYQALIYPGVNMNNEATEDYVWRFEEYNIKNHHDLIMVGMDEMKEFVPLVKKLYLQGETKATNPYVSPLLAEDLSRMPETLIVTSEFDYLRLEGEAYARKLARFGVRTKLVRYEGVDHAFIDRIGSCPQAEDCMNEIAKGIKRIFHS
jgi:acetyl esterase